MTETTSTPEDVKPTMQEIADSLTGYEEMGIERAFGKALENLSITTSARALGFVLAKREGQTHDEAFKTVMELRALDLADRFADVDQEPMPEEPVTTAGKDDSPQPIEPGSSPGSAS